MDFSSMAILSCFGPALKTSFNQLIKQILVPHSPTVPPLPDCGTVYFEADHQLLKKAASEQAATKEKH